MPPSCPRESALTNCGKGSSCKEADSKLQISPYTHKQTFKHQGRASVGENNRCAAIIMVVVVICHNNACIQVPPEVVPPVVRLRGGSDEAVSKASGECAESHPAWGSPLETGQLDPARGQQMLDEVSADSPSPLDVKLFVLGTWSPPSLAMPLLFCAYFRWQCMGTNHSEYTQTRGQGRQITR